MKRLVDAGHQLVEVRPESLHRAGTPYVGQVAIAFAAIEALEQRSIGDVARARSFILDVEVDSP